MRKEVLTNKEYKKFLGDLHKLGINTDSQYHI